MGYTTEFNGEMKITPPLPSLIQEFFKKFSTTRRMARNVDAQYGIEGEFFVDGTGSMGQDFDSTVINGNKPPETQPSLWCQWEVTADTIKWDEGEKFYSYIDWMYYIINRILKPLGHTVNGTIDWRGEEFGDDGTIEVKDNVLFVDGKIYKSNYTDMVDLLTPPNVKPKELGEGTLKMFE